MKWAIIIIIIIIISLFLRIRCGTNGKLNAESTKNIKFMMVYICNISLNLITSLDFLLLLYVVCVGRIKDSGWPFFS